MEPDRDLKARERAASWVWRGLAVVLAASCTAMPEGTTPTPAVPPPEGTSAGGETESTEEASQEGTTAPTGEFVSLAYDHEVRWDFSGGADGGMSMTIRVGGSIPLPAMPGVHQELRGSAQLSVTGSFRFWTEDESCDCSLTDALQANARGRTWARSGTSDSPEVDEVVNIEVRETWYTRSSWSCGCSDPDLAGVAQTALQRMPSYAPQGLVDRTLQFLYACSGSITEPFIGQGGQGRYRWTYHALPGDEAVCSGRYGTWGPPLTQVGAGSGPSGSTEPTDPSTTGTSPPTGTGTGPTGGTDQTTPGSSGSTATNEGTSGTSVGSGGSTDSTSGEGGSGSGTDTNRGTRRPNRGSGGSGGSSDSTSGSPSTGGNPGGMRR